MNYFINKKLIVILLSLITVCFSQSTQNIKELRDNYEKLKKDRTSAEPENIKEIDSEISISREALLTKYEEDLTKRDSLMNLSKFFGFDYFTKRDTIKFWENLPIPSNYYIGPGDELVISLWGETQLRKIYKVSRDGTIYDDKVGLLYLSGKNIKETKNYLISEFGKVYSTLNGRNPSSFIDVSLGDLQSINVNFVGELMYPGVHILHPFSNVITGLIQAGGIDTTSSIRKIKIIRKGQETIDVDLYSYLISGDMPKNIQLRDQDVVLVPVRKNTIKIDSAVVRPGIYEYIEGENLKQLLDYAGGLLFNSSQLIGLIRINPKRSTEGSNYINSYFLYEDLKSVSAANGDNIIVSKIPYIEEYVEIIGQVKKPGKYLYFSGMTVKNLVDLSGGLSDKSFLKSVYLDKTHIVRRNPDKKYEEVLSVDLKQVINEGPDSKILLNNHDKYVVYPNSNYYENENVMITGQVNIPGSYALKSDNETLESILKRSGNLTSKALTDGISIYRNKKYFTSKYDFINEDLKSDRIRVAWKDKGIILMPGDSITVKESTGTINIMGEVFNPGIIEYQKGRTISFYINSAGGITNSGDRKNIVIIYANGLVSPKKRLRSAPVRDGSTIIVNKKDAIEPFDLTEFISNWTSLITTIMTAVLLTRQV